MSTFLTYLEIGFDHIIDVRGYDHILFVLALCAIYSTREWKSILILVTAFTVGHSLTLALSVLDIVKVDSALVEFLIVATILVTAIANLFYKSDSLSKGKMRANYIIALGFGLIHGLGFSNYLNSLLGRSGDILMPLFGFNIGLEIGQLLIVATFLLMTFVLVDMLRVSKRDWRMVISSAIAGMALMLLIENYI